MKKHLLQGTAESQRKELISGAALGGAAMHWCTKHLTWQWWGS